jgi:hypothetical protein
VVYDPATERFFLAAIGLDPQDVRRRCTPGDCTAHFFVAVSKSSRPASLETGDWYFYALDSTLDGAEPTARWADFVQLGLNDTVLVLTANMNGFGGGASTGTKIRILEKAKLVAGEPVSWTDFAGVRDPSGFTGFTPVLHLDRTHRFFLVRPCGSSTAGPTIVEIRDPLSSPTLVFQSVPALAHCRTEHYVDGRQPTGLGLSTGGAAGAIYRNQSLWNAEVTTVEFEGTPVAAVRWYQIDVSGWPAEPALVQTSVLADAGISYFVSALAVDEADNMAMVVARSSAHEFPSIYYTGRHVSDSAGVLRSPALLKAGTTSLIADDSRYGDYFGAAIDAADGSAWLVGQFVSGTTKSTSWVGRVSLPGFTGRRLFPGQSISSRNGRFRLLYRADGNLVLDDDEARETVWSADTQSPTPGMAIMQLDGNLVVYDRDGHVRWSSGTFGNRNAYLGVEDDGNLVIYAWDGRPLWDRFHSRREDR